MIEHGLNEIISINNDNYEYDHCYNDDDVQDDDDDDDDD